MSFQKVRLKYGQKVVLRILIPNGEEIRWHVELRAVVANELSIEYQNLRMKHFQSNIDIFQRCHRFYVLDVGQSY